MSRKKLGDRVQNAEKRTPPPPLPKPDPEKKTLAQLLASRLRGDPWTALKQALDHIHASGDPDDLDPVQHRLLDLVACLLQNRDERGVKIKDLDGDGREQLFVNSLLTVTKCSLYQALFHRCWQIEAGDEVYLPPDRDLAAVFDARTGEAWTPISEDERIKEGKKLARDLAEIRERQLLEGAPPVASGQRAREIVNELYDPENGRPAQRRRRLEELGETEEVDDVT